MKKIFILIITNALIFFTYNAFAYKVIKVKNKKLLIRLSPGESLQKKDTFYVINHRGKKKAIISIIKVRGSKAIAKILKGKAKAGWSLQVRKRRSASNKQKINRKRPTESYASKATNASNFYRKKQKNPFNHLSFLWGLSLNSLKINDSTHSGTSVFNFETGTTFFLPNRPMFGLKILSSSENFTLEATCTSAADVTTDCNANILYLGGGALAVIRVPLARKFSLWGGVGIKLLIPISKEVTKLESDYSYLNEDSIKLTSALLISGGFKFNFNHKLSIPFNISYTAFPSSDDVTGHSVINFQTGLVYHF